MQPETATIYVANIVMANDIFPYVMVSADPGIEIA